MMRQLTNTLIVALAAIFIATPAVMSQQGEDRVYRDEDDRSYDNGYDNGERARVDRYLGVEIWPNHHDGEYYEGDRITLNFRANRDAFVAIYSIDSRGRVNMLFPSSPNGDNFIQGGVTHQLPSGYDDYDLVVSGPDGVENIQIIASREPFPVPDWYPASGLVADDDDRMAYMDWLNERYFVRYGGQRFAYDRTAIYINEWEDYYFRPVYYPTYHPWTLAGNVYIDYPWGSSVYINGIYWGCAPLYLPRVYVGWHTITIYDRWGYCWESDFHVSRYNTLVLNVDVIHTSAHVKSKYREVREAGYRDPVKHGYPNYSQKVASIEKSGKIRTRELTVTKADGQRVTERVIDAPKKHIRGTTQLVKTERGIESSAISPNDNDQNIFGRSNKGRGSIDNTSRGSSDGSGGYIGSGKGRTSGGSLDTDRGSSTGKGSRGTVDTDRGRNDGDYYQKKSGDRKPGYQPGQGSAPSDRGSRGSDRKVKDKGAQRESAPAPAQPQVKPAEKPQSKGSSGKVESKPAPAPTPKSSGNSGGSKSSGGGSKSSGGSRDGKGKGR